MNKEQIEALTLFLRHGAFFTYTDIYRLGDEFDGDEALHVLAALIVLEQSKMHKNPQLEDKVRLTQREVQRLLMRSIKNQRGERLELSKYVEARRRIWRERLKHRHSLFYRAAIDAMVNVESSASWRLESAWSSILLCAATDMKDEHLSTDLVREEVAKCVVEALLKYYNVDVETFYLLHVE
jgi:hypothetical protein